MKPWLENVGDTTLVHVTVIPRSGKPRVVESAGDLRLYVAQPPEQGRATEAARKLLSEHLRVTPSCVSLLKGATSRHKIFLVNACL